MGRWSASATAGSRVRAQARRRAASDSATPSARCSPTAATAALRARTSVTAGTHVHRGRCSRTTQAVRGFRDGGSSGGSTAASGLPARCAASRLHVPTIRFLDIPLRRRSARRADRGAAVSGWRLRQTGNRCRRRSRRAARTDQRHQQLHDQRAGRSPHAGSDFRRDGSRITAIAEEHLMLQFVDIPFPDCIAFGAQSDPMLARRLVDSDRRRRVGKSELERCCGMPTTCPSRCARIATITRYASISIKFAVALAASRSRISSTSKSRKPKGSSPTMRSSRPATSRCTGAMAAAPKPTTGASRARHRHAHHLPHAHREHDKRERRRDDRLHHRSRHHSRAISAATPMRGAGEFRVPCRYDTDRLPAVAINRRADDELLVECPSIPLVEVNEGECMKDIPSSIESMIASGSSTLAWGMRVERRMASVYGYTSHDRPARIDSDTYLQAERARCVEHRRRHPV